MSEDKSSICDMKFVIKQIQETNFSLKSIKYCLFNELKKISDFFLFKNKE